MSKWSFHFPEIFYCIAHSFLSVHIACRWLLAASLWHEIAVAPPRLWAHSGVVCCSSILCSCHAHHPLSHPLNGPQNPPTTPFFLSAVACCRLIPVQFSHRFRGVSQPPSNTTHTQTKSSQAKPQTPLKWVKCVLVGVTIMVYLVNGHIQWLSD